MMGELSFQKRTKVRAPPITAVSTSLRPPLELTLFVMAGGTIWRSRLRPIDFARAKL